MFCALKMLGGSIFLTVADVWACTYGVSEIQQTWGSLHCTVMLQSALPRI
jgi:hypothetical protein